MLGHTITRSSGRMYLWSDFESITVIDGYRQQVCNLRRIGSIPAAKGCTPGPNNRPDVRWRDQLRPIMWHVTQLRGIAQQTRPSSGHAADHGADPRVAIGPERLAQWHGEAWRFVEARSSWACWATAITSATRPSSSRTAPGRSPPARPPRSPFSACRGIASRTCSRVHVAARAHRAVQGALEAAARQGWPGRHPVRRRPRGRGRPAGHVRGLD